MGKTREDYELETGLANDFDGTITDVYFGAPRKEYAELGGTSEPGLYLILETPDLEQPVEQWYSCGAAKQWQVGRGGKEITSAKSPDSHRFNMNSRAGVIVARMFELVGEGDKKKGQEFFLKRDRYMTESEFFTGLSFHWLREPLKTVSGESRDVLMPNKYLGEAVPAVKKAEVPTEDLDAVLISLAEGKVARELKQAAMKDEKISASKDYLNEVIKGTKLTELEKLGKLVKSPEGRYL